MLRRIWLISANKIKPSESICKQSSQTQTQVIIVTNNCHNTYFRFRSDTEPNEAFKRRNMLMNIILRPGGGDKSRALPSTYSSHVFTNPEFSICDCFFREFFCIV